MKIITLLCFIAMSNIAFGQTENHKIIAGTKCSIIPPAGFVPATNFIGFQNDSTGASIMVTELPAPVQVVSKGFTASALKANGMTLIDKQTINFNASKATYVKVRQPANGIIYLKQILVFGDSTKTVIVNGIYPAANKVIEKDIKKALLSTSYNENQNDNPLELVKFTIDVSGTEFMLAKFIAGSLIYTIDGQMPTEKPSLIVGNSIARVATENQKQYSIERLKELTKGEYYEIKKMNAIQIDSLQGYEIVANGKNENAKAELTYQVILFEDTGDYYIIVGVAKEDFENSLKSFRTIARTFKRK